MDYHGGGSCLFAFLSHYLTRQIEWHTTLITNTGELCVWYLFSYLCYHYFLINYGSFFFKKKKMY